MTKSEQLISILSDGQFHSGSELGRQLEISRAAVWKHIHQIRERLELPVLAVTGRGYRLADELELLNEKSIRVMLGPGVSEIAALHIFHSLDSTNQWLLQQAALGAPSGSVCLAESQTAGRGRRGRRWVSPYAQNINLSMLWRFEQGAAALTGLSLAVAVAVARALERVGVPSVQLKWPNDVLHGDRKLCGILLDVRGEGEGPCSVVAGIGVNVAMQQQQAAEIDQPWTSVEQIVGRSMSRNRLVAELISELIRISDQFRENGFRSVMPEWTSRDYLRDRKVDLLFPGHKISGYARGVDEFGALQIEQNGEIQRYFSGEVSVRRREIK